MIGKWNISAAQMAILLHSTVTATAILVVPSNTALHAERNLWISPILASLVGFFTVYICYQLHRFYPGKTIIDHSCLILGRLPGKVIGLLFLLYFLHINGIILLEYSGFILDNILPRTPGIVVMGIMILSCAVTVRGGIEVLGRLGQLFLPIVLFFSLAIFVLLIPEMDVKKMLPILENGMIPTIKGAIVPQAWFSEFLIISFLFPYLTDKGKGLKWGMISVFLVMVVLVVTNFAALFVLGETTNHLVYPIMSMVRYISIADFLEHLESLMMALWVVGAFLKISVFYFALATGTAQWLDLEDYRPLVLPFGFLLLVIGKWSAPNLQDLLHFLSTTAPFYMTSIQCLLPLSLLLIAFMRNRKERKRGKVG